MLGPRLNTDVRNEDAHPQDFGQLAHLDHTRLDARETSYAHVHLQRYDDNKDPVRLTHALHNVVEHAKNNEDVGQGIYTPSDEKSPTRSKYFLSKLTKYIPGTQRLARWHWGNFVVDRRTGEKIWEDMPIYARIGMHLLFYGPAEEWVVQTSPLATLFKRESVSSGRHFDSAESVKHIPYYIKTYKIDCSELLETDWTKYKSYNAFFARKLKEGARPIDSADDSLAYTSCADCRLTVFESVEAAKEFWIKGTKFTISTLINDPEMAKIYEGGGVAIFRLAPQDYHRYHAPCDGKIGKTLRIDGTYFTVNPITVNENLNVFTENKRAVTYIYQEGLKDPLAMVQVGALLVGSIVVTVKESQQVKKGDDFGYYQYGGSTNILLFPSEAKVKFDQDLIENSKNRLETLVRVGNHIARRE